MESTKRQPAAFLAHGSPMLAVEEDGVTSMLRRWGGGLKPRAIVVVSAHWESPGAIRVTGAERPTMIYDFGGFPPELYDLRYPSPGDPALAAEIARRLEATVDPRRGIDHGAWVPIRHAFPDANIPMLEVSLPVPRAPELVTRMGRELGSLREDGVLLVGSGGLVHNLRRVQLGDKQAPAEGWAVDFDRWVGERAASLDPAALAGYRQAPHAAEAVPTSEHYDPVFFVLGAALPGDRLTTLYEGFHYATLSMRSFELKR